jgi:hypothetical protein
MIGGVQPYSWLVGPRRTVPIRGGEGQGLQTRGSLPPPHRPHPSPIPRMALPAAGSTTSVSSPSPLHHPDIHAAARTSLLYRHGELLHQPWCVVTSPLTIFLSLSGYCVDLCSSHLKVEHPTDPHTLDDPVVLSSDTVEFSGSAA